MQTESFETEFQVFDKRFDKTEERFRGVFKFSHNQYELRAKSIHQMLNKISLVSWQVAKQVLQRFGI